MIENKIININKAIVITGLPILDSKKIEILKMIFTDTLFSNISKVQFFYVTVDIDSQESEK